MIILEIISIGIHKHIVHVTMQRSISRFWARRTPRSTRLLVGDLIGDPHKDTAGPALNTVIKLLNTVAIVFVAIFFGFIGI